MQRAARPLVDGAFACGAQLTAEIANGVGRARAGVGEEGREGGAVRGDADDVRDEGAQGDGGEFDPVCGGLGQRVVDGRYDVGLQLGQVERHVARSTGDGPIGHLRPPAAEHPGLEIIQACTVDEVPISITITAEVAMRSSCPHSR